MVHRHVLNQTYTITCIQFTHICQKTDKQYILCQSPSIFQNTVFDRSNDLLHFYHAHHSVTTSTDSLKDTVFSPDEPLQGSCNSFTVSKCRFKFGNLQIVCYYSDASPSTGLWENISCHLEDDLIASILDWRLK